MSSLRAQFVQTGKEPKERRGDAHFARHGVVISQIKKTSRRENREGKKKISGSVVEWHHHRISVVVHCWPFQKFCTHPERRRKRRTGAGFRPWAMTRSRSRRRHCLVTFMCDSIPGSFARWISWRQMALATRSLCWRNEWIRCAALGLARLSNLTAMMACWAPLQLSNQCSNGSNSSAVNSRGGCGAITMAAMTATLNTHPKTNKRLKSVSCQTHTHTRSCYFPPELPLLLRHTGSLFGRRSAEPSFGNLTNGVSTRRPGRQTKTRRCPSFVIVQPRIGNEREWQK